MLMARAARMAMVASEMDAWHIETIFAQRDKTGESSAKRLCWC